MIPRAHNSAVPSALARILASPRFATSLTHVALGVAFSISLLKSVMGWAGLAAVLVGLVALAAFSLSARRASIEWHGLLPISILVFLGWSTLTLVWSGYTVATLTGVGYQLTFAFLAVYIALARDTIQIVRATGDVLRVLLGVSLALEVVSGLLLDLPIAFLGIQGNLARLGPIQGIFGSRNVLGLVALLAFITFAVELRSRSLRRGPAIGSLVLAGLCILLAGSPVIMLVALFVGVAALALYWLRRTPAEGRWMLQLGLLGATVIALIGAWIARGRLIELLNAGSEFEVRYTLWREMWRLIALHPLEGWGWAGYWPNNVTPYGWLDFVTGRDQSSGLNAFLDVYFQAGLVGFLAFVALVGLAFVRSWLLASNKRTFVHVWPALTLVALLVASAAESTILVEFGWLLLVVCAMKASQGMSWRSALARHPRRFED
ncbi:O-antigen ligase [Cryobacterium psychrotolerans]|uniref:O-antigen ligase n=1 Tax=Cryobacterium psychrotolerans TaxID=386301 RepID=A0A1G9CI41_9MICO|nr:O-antigen ligase family protein [Cryobacterium psychrotolerans]TFD84278.1 O-antigen ligase family protein [Cryobacterium psychrotolerans]SDK51266.1 O-antigen ligase [Cryobacterium psychrotolerans]